MKLKIILPSSVFLETEAAKVKAEGPQGGFCLLERHIDFVSAIVPGLFVFTPLREERGEARAQEERFYALDRGMLVKQGDSVLVVTSNAVAGELGRLEDAVREMLEEQEETERRSQTSVARMEADFVRRFVGFGHG